MKERSLQDQEWLEQKRVNHEINRMLADGTFWHGNYFRATVMARKIIPQLLQGDERTVQSQ